MTIHRSLRNPCVPKTVLFEGFRFSHVKIIWSKDKMNLLGNKIVFFLIYLFYSSITTLPGINLRIFEILRTGEAFLLSLVVQCDDVVINQVPACLMHIASVKQRISFLVNSYWKLLDMSQNWMELQSKICS